MRKCNSYRLVCVGGDKVSSAQYLYYGNHAVIFDLGKNPECTELLESMRGRGVEYVDAICITHAHDDHIAAGNGLAVIASQMYVEECTVYYASPKSDEWHGADYTSEYRALSRAAELGYHSAVDIDEEGYDIYHVPGVLIQAFNTTKEKHDHYPNDFLSEDYTNQNRTELNNYSVIYVVDVAGCRFAVTGDLMPNAQHQNLGVLAGCDIAQIPHHALNIWSDPDFAAQLPRMCWVSAYGGAFWDKVARRFPDTAGRELYATQMQELEFELAGRVRVVEGVPLRDSGEPAGNLLTPGTDLFTLGFGRYYSPNNEFTAQLVNAPDFTSGFALEVQPGARTGKHLVAVALFGWHSTVARCNPDIGTWAYVIGERRE